MADLVAPQGPWVRRVEFDIDAAGHRFAFRPREILFLDTNDEVDDLLAELWNALDLEGDVADARDRFGDDSVTCGLQPDGSLDEPVTLADDFAAVNGASMITITFTDHILRGSPYEDASTVEILEQLERAGVSFSPSLNNVYFSAGVMWGSPVTWSNVGGTPVTWSGVGGAPVTWSGVGGAPVTWSGFFGAPVTWSGVGGTPVTWSGVGGAPVTWSGVGGAPVTWSAGMGAACGCCCTDAADAREVGEDEKIFTSARAALDPGYAKRRICPTADTDDLLAEGTCRVVVLDTGLLPNTVDASIGIPGLENFDEFDVDGDNVVDAAAGHGTFIAGIIRRLAPEASIEVGRVLSSFGDGSDCVIATVLRHLAEQEVPGILNLSFVGYLRNDEPPIAVKRAIEALQDKGWIIVAAAGNDASCRPTYPAALPGVISVGALAPWGPAWFTNYGEWVRACAPGVDIISQWYDFTNEDDLMITDKAKATDASGWAAWSGTSFSAPIVAAALARDVISAGPPNNLGALRAARQAIVDDTTRTIDQMTADLIAQDSAIPAIGGSSLDKRIAQLRQAVERVIDDPRLARIPCLGTIVNDHL